MGKLEELELEELEELELEELEELELEELEELQKGGAGGGKGGSVSFGVIDEEQPLCCVKPGVWKLKPLPVGAPLPP